MGLIYQGIPQNLAKFIHDNFRIDNFVETGTYYGNTALWASNYFKQVYTVERATKLFEIASKRLRDVNNIKCVLGDSKTELSKIVDELDGPALFWLDAHFSGGETAGGGEKAPIMYEIEVINSSEFENFILIDDARLFLFPPPDPHNIDEYPSIVDVLESLRRNNRYVAVYNDVIVCVPGIYKEKAQIFIKKEANSKKPEKERSCFYIYSKKIFKEAVFLCKDCLRIADKVKYYNQFNSFRKKCLRFSVFETFPVLNEKNMPPSFDRHYTYHPAWAAKVISGYNPVKHLDISSILSFACNLSAFIPVEYYEYNVPSMELENLVVNKVDLLNLPFENDSIQSLSCMHVVEHVGLGRYGDEIDVDGDLKAASELSRVLAKGGNLLFVVPLSDNPRVEFNAHRIYSYKMVLDMFPDLDLKEFAVIPDKEGQGGLIRNAKPDMCSGQHYACGCFHFEKAR